MIPSRNAFVAQLVNLTGTLYEIGGRLRADQYGVDCWGLGARALVLCHGPDLGGLYTQSAFDGLPAIGASELQPGDCIFYGPEPGKVNHVVFWLGGAVLSASNGNAETTTPEIAAARHARVMAWASPEYGHGTPIQGYRSMRLYLA